MEHLQSAKTSRSSKGPDYRTPAIRNNPTKLTSSILRVADYIGSFVSSSFALLGDVDPWGLTSRSAAIVQQQIASLSDGDFIVKGEIARHKSATVEQGAVLKSPLVLGALYGATQAKLAASFTSPAPLYFAS